jgi:uridine kinase
MKQRPHLIGIAGPSGAGKSFLAEHLVRKLANAVIVPIDAYYPDLSHLSLDHRRQRNFDDPTILDADLLLAQVAALAHGDPIQQPIYDFARHTRTAETLTVHPRQFVVVEGLFTLYWAELRALLHTRVYVDLTDAICLERRIARDVQHRGRTPVFVEEQFRNSVIPMAERYVRPTAEFADVTVDGAAPIEEGVAAVLAHLRRRSVI